MLPINLLPNYIFDKNKKRNVLIGYGLALAAIVAFFLVMSAGIQKTLDEAKADLADATTKQGTYNNRVADITKVQSDIAELKTKQTFIANAQTYNNAWPATFELFRNLTAHDILLKSMVMDKDHKTMHLAAFAPGDSNSAEFAIAKWVKALESHPDIIERVSFTVPPHPFVGMAPTNGAAGMGGMGSGRGGMSGGLAGLGGKGAAMGMPGSGGGMPSLGMAGGGTPGSAGFAGGGGAGGNDATGPAEIEGKPGINFNVAATLKTALANGLPVPSWGGGGGAAAPTGGFGGPMGPPAGMGGPPVGMPGGASSVPGGRE